MKVLGSHHLLLIPQHTVTCYDLHRKPDVQGYDKRRKKKKRKRKNKPSWPRRRRGNWRKEKKKEAKLTMLAKEEKKVDKKVNPKRQSVT